MSIIILQHHAQYGAGRLAMTLRDHGFKLATLRADQDQPMPATLDGIEGVITLGGTQQISEGHAFIAREQSFLRMAHEAALPIFGIGLGAQLIATALGGTTSMMEHPEAGFVTIDIPPAAHTEPILAGIPWRTAQFMRHAAQIDTLPPGAMLLGSSKRCKNQAFRVGLRTFGFQHHPECDRTMIDAIIGDAKTMLHASGVTTEEFARDTEQHYDNYRRVGDRLLLNFVNYAIPRMGSEVLV